MYTNYKQHVNDAFPGIEGESIDLGRVLWAIGSDVFFGLAVYAVVVKGQSFDAISYGTAFGAILAGGGAALGFKAKTAPPAQTNVEK